MIPRTILIFVLGILLTSCTTSSVEEEEIFTGESSSKLEVELSPEEQTLIFLVNEYRASKGLNELEFSSEIYEFASGHNEFMISKGQLSHANFDSRASIISEITSANFIAENVTKDHQIVDAALQEWLNSTPHKNTIEGDFTHTTLSIMVDNEGNPYYTQIFFRK